MISHSRIKLIQSLNKKKSRQNTGLFVVEGDKMVFDLNKSSFEIAEVFADPDWMEKNSSRLTNLEPGQLFKVTEKELKKISFLKTQIGRAHV